MFTDCATVLERCTLVRMINRLHRSPKSASVTSPARVGLLTCGFTLVTLATAALNTPVAHAEQPNTDICDPSSDYYIGGALCSTPTPTPSSGGSGGGFSNAVSDFIGSPMGTLLFFGGIAAVIAWVVIASRRESAEEKAEKRAAEAARGQRIAELHHAEQVAAAEQRALAQLPDPSVYDPMGMGVAAPAVQVELPPAPSTDPEDLKRYNVFNAVVPWEPGSAFAAVVNRDGDWSRARGAFASACEAAGLGETDEAGTFTPAAVVAEVRTIGGDTDAVVLAVRPAGLHIGSAQLDRARPYLVRTARVAEASPFEREPSTDLYLTTLRNVVREQSAPAPEAAPINDPSTWEW
ncbi:hypothetical protein MAHJHV65_00060 [Mycobacterium avium subsp. hominissuis]